MGIVAAIIIAIASACVGAGVTELYFRSRYGIKEDESLTAEDESILSFVETFKEILIHQADKIESDFIERITAKAEQILVKQDAIQDPGDRNQACENPHNNTP